MPFGSDGAWIPHERLSTNSTNFLEMTQYADRVSSNTFGVFILLAIFIIILAVSYKKNPETSLQISLFVTTIVSYMMAAVDILLDEAAIAMTFLLVVSVMFLFRGGSSNV